MFSIFQTLIAVLLAGSVSSWPPVEGPFPVWKVSLFSAGISFVPIIWGRILARFRGRRALLPFWMLFPSSSILSYAAILHWAQWSQVPVLLGLPNSEFVRHLALLVPFFFTVVLYWAESYRLERRVSPTLGEYISYQTRTLLFTLAPMLFYLVGADLLAANRGVRLALENISLLRMGATLLFLLLLIVFVPFAARIFWKTISLPAGELRSELEALAVRARFRYRDILVWKTKGLSINAAILGLFARTRYVILTDGLVQLLSPTEVRAVFGHEMAHAKRHHVSHFVALALGGLFLFLIVTEFVLPQEDVWVLLASVIFFSLSWVVFGYLSRRFELEADLFGAKVTGELFPFVLALEKVGAFSGQGRWHGSWRHFSVATRVEFLHKISQAPELAEKFLKRLRMFSRAIFLFFAATGAIYLVLLLQRLPIERAQLDFAYGDYKQVSQRLESLRETNSDARLLWSLAQFGDRFREEEGERWQERLVLAGREALESERFSEAYACLSLASFLEIGAESTQRLQQAAQYLMRNQTEALAEFLSSEGKSLAQDPNLAPIFTKALQRKD